MAPTATNTAKAPSVVRTPGLVHVGMTVRSLDVSIDFYCGVLGLELLSEPVPVSTDDARIGPQVLDVFGQPVKFRLAHLLMRGGSALELFQFVDPLADSGHDSPFRIVGPWHVCLHEPDIDGAVERIGASRGRVRSRIWEVIPGEPYRMCYCEDPDGNIVELFTHPHAEVFGNRDGFAPRRQPAG